ncbi:MAG TPA: cytochrome c biogenesis protein DipZ [Steroidobacteraceae bacterium]|jgi:cytochrome c biogenesis protein CcdA/thiol-disulfide isomerase/thioredoxin|nr:cytochrome c biogenesis protein DipZ [Steroidobacteraceae bacterium]
MSLAILVFLGGVLTILSPCILPVLPFVFARSEQKFLTNGLPMLLGMAVTFAGIATLAAVGGAWAVRVNQYGRVFALVLLTLFAATLLSTRLADWLARPFVALGNRLAQPAPAQAGKFTLVNSLLLGVATGLLWAPCAGPILGLILTGAAISGPNSRTTLLLFAYAAGAAASLAVALFAGGRVFAVLKKSLGTGEWLRRALGVAVLVAVVAIVFGWDTTVLTRLSLNGTNSIEQSLIDKINPREGPAGGSMTMAMSNSNMAMSNSNMAMSNRNAAGPAMMESSAKAAGNLPVEGEIPSFAGAVLWLNSPPLTPEALRGKVVMVDFWTYSCINCLRALPYVKGWYEKYKDHGLVVVGVHAPEFAFEKDPGNVRRAVADLKITYPVALDNDYAIWQAFNNQYWPAHYFIDAGGRIRAHHFGEGNYDESEETIRKLLTEAGNTGLPAPGMGALAAVGVQAPADEAHDQSPETYVGYRRAENFASPGGFAQDQARAYAAPAALKLNQWALSGSWKVDPEKAILAAAPGKITFRFYARDLHLVLGPGVDGKPVHFRVTLDGAAPAGNHGADTDSSGAGVIDGQRLYQLIRQAGAVGEHVFTIEFLDSAIQAYSFTFG